MAEKIGRSGRLMRRGVRLLVRVEGRVSEAEKRV
jgi:hypothetical protein